MKLIYHPAAEAEVVAAARFYELRVKGLGTQFLDEFDRCIARIVESPVRWRIVLHEKRRYLMPRFPYGIYYRVTGDEIRILVVKHHSQHPDYGLGRRYGCSAAPI
ncbi:MAG: type II toxin-antitoxin system RelE/ParE family toxin [Opitutales bacterium]